MTTGMKPGDTGGRPPGFSFKNLKTFDSFKTPAYRVYYAAMIGQWAVMSMQIMVRSLLVYRVTDSAAAIGIIALAQAIPSLIVSFWGGVVADRMQKKYVLLIGRSSMALSTLIIAIPLATGYINPAHPESWWLLVVCAALQGVAGGFAQPALMSIIPEIVSKDQVMNAISLSTTGQYVFRLIGPAAAGFLIDAYGFAPVYFLMGGLYALAALGTILLPRTTVYNTGRRGTLRDIFEGFKYIKRETVILFVIVFALCHVIAGQPYQQLLPVFTESILNVGAKGLGILTTVSAAGALVGSLAIGSLPNRKRGLLLILSGVIMGVSVIIFSYSQSWILSVIIIPFIGLGPSIHATMTATLVQTYAKPEFRGRMQSFVSMSQGFASLGIYLAGILSDVVGVQWAVGGMAFFLVIASLLFIFFATSLRKAD